MKIKMKKLIDTIFNVLTFVAFGAALVCSVFFGPMALLAGGTIFCGVGLCNLLEKKLSKYFSTELGPKIDEYKKIKKDHKHKPVKDQSIDKDLYLKKFAYKDMSATDPSKQPYLSEEIAPYEGSEQNNNINETFNPDLLGDPPPDRENYIPTKADLDELSEIELNEQNNNINETFNPDLLGDPPPDRENYFPTKADLDELSELELKELDEQKRQNEKLNELDKQNEQKRQNDKVKPLRNNSANNLGPAKNAGKKGPELSI